MGEVAIVVIVEPSHFSTCTYISAWFAPPPVSLSQASTVHTPAGICNSPGLLGSVMKLAILPVVDLVKLAAAPVLAVSPNSYIVKPPNVPIDTPPLK